MFVRDGWTCQKCGKRGGMLHPHHILNFAEHPTLRFRVDNGVTLCVSHHREFHATYGSAGNTREQIEEYL